MSKWIDADALKQQVESPYTEYPIMIQIRRAIKEFIDSAPTIDIVCCAECKHRNVTEHGKLSFEDYCRWHPWESPDDDDYCSYGERKEGEE